MPTYATTGIVIGRTNFGEADRIIRLLTPDHGKLSAVAKGVRKIKSRAAGHLEPFGETNLMLATGKNLDVITSARLAWYPHTLATDYPRLQFAFSLSAALDRLLEPGHPQPALYAVAKEALQVTNITGPSSLLELWFKLRLLECLGYRPSLEGCAVCGRTDTDAGYRFDATRGGLLCANDSAPTAPPIDIPTIKLWRLLTTHSYATIAQLQGAPTLAERSLPLCHQFYEEHLGYRFETALV